MQYKEKAFLSIVVYLRNASVELEKSLNALQGEVRKHFEWYEFILVDDFSSDDTFQKGTELLNNLNMNGVVIRLSRFHGKELAMLCGADKSMGDYVFQMESLAIDYPHTLLMEMFEKAKDGHEVVIACPNQTQLLSSIFFYKIFNKISYLDISVQSERLSLMNRRALNAILSVNERIRFRKVLINLVGFRPTIVSFNVTNENFKNRSSFLFRMKLAVEMIVFHTNIGHRLPIWMAFGFLLFSFSTSGFAASAYWFRAEVVSGWTSLMIFLSFAFSGLFMILGILSEYIVKILRETINLPLYTIQHEYSSYPDKLSKVRRKV
jgi:polyisoprenyl-phosphate glycosyltransferase